MSTITVTETDQTIIETISETVNSSEQKTEQNSENNTVKYSTKMKKNKNAFLRKSKSACSCENLDPEQKQSQDKDLSVTETKVVAFEGNGERDSALGSSTYSSLSLDSLINDVDDLNVQDIGETTPNVSAESKSAKGWSPQSEHHFCTPKLPVPTNYRAVNDVKRKVIFKHDKIQPVQAKPAGNAFRKQPPYHNAFGQIEIDGERSRQRASHAYQVNPELDNLSGYSLTVSSISSVSSSAPVSSLSSCSEGSIGGMSDFVILHTDDDLTAAGCFMEHLLNDIGILDLTVDLLGNINAGQPGMQSLKTLHDNYRYILTFVTTNLESDRYSRFLNEIILTFGLREGNGKEDRVVPVFNQEGYCKIIELSIIGGLKYFNLHSSEPFMRESYINCVKRLVRTGREKFP